MPRRTQLFQLAPWTGGINTSVDPGVLPSNDLVQADNVVFSTTGTRLKRQGFSYFDTSLPAVISRSSTGLTRKLIFASSISQAAPTDQLLVVGEQLKITNAGNANYNATDAIISAISTTNTANDTISYTFSTATSFSESLTAATPTVARNYLIIGTHDYWYFDIANNRKIQTQIAVTSQGLFFRYSAAGRRTQILKSGAGATALASTTIASCDIRTFNNLCIVTLSGLGNTPKYIDAYVADVWKDLPNAPDANIMQEHLGRLFMDDKTTVDRVHFSSTFDQTEWLGVGDSGAIDIAQGDGDTVGISAIFPPYKGRLIIGKGDSLWQVLGDAPETFELQPMTKGFGPVSHKAAVAVDLDDIYFPTRRGFHSLLATNTTGDFASNYLSKKIQPTFNKWARAELKHMQGAYLSEINSVAWTVAEDGSDRGTALWIFNPTIEEPDGSKGVWYRWPDLNPQSICIRLDSNQKRIVCGNDAGRLMISSNATYTDFGTRGISFRAKSGTIYVDGNPQTIKGFKKLYILFKPRSRFNFTAYFKVDDAPVQPILFSQTIQGDKLGVAFVLGRSSLGSDVRLAPVAADVVGFGRGCSIEVFQSGVEAQVEIYGFMVEWESADIADEVIQNG